MPSTGICGCPTALGIRAVQSPEEVTDAYLKYTGMLKDMIKRGFSAGVYTQTSDVEIEVNGLMTYDRKLIKGGRGENQRAELKRSVNRWTSKKKKKAGAQ